MIQNQELQQKQLERILISPTFILSYLFLTSMICHNLNEVCFIFMRKDAHSFHLDPF